MEPEGTDTRFEPISVKPESSCSLQAVSVIKSKKKKEKVGFRRPEKLLRNLNKSFS